MFNLKLLARTELYRYKIFSIILYYYSLLHLPVLICRKMNRNGRSALKTAERDLFNSTIAGEKEECVKYKQQ